MAVQCESLISSLKTGGSISVNGTCLTATKIQNDMIYFDLLEETYQVTSFSQMACEETINLELPLKYGDRVDGHFVTGHIDYSAKILNILKRGQEKEFQVEIDSGVRKFIVSKGSIALDGVSLTIGSVTERYFSVYLIPLTLEKTNLGKKIKGELLNVEVDILARYGFLPNSNRNEISVQLLKEHGFI